MIITIYTLNFSSAHKADAPFNVSFKPPDQQKSTIFIGHPHDRRTTPDTIKPWKIIVPETASMQGDEVMWFDEGEVRFLTAVEVFTFAQKGMHGFRLDEG